MDNILCKYVVTSTPRRSKSDSDIKTLSPEIQNDTPITPLPPEKPPNNKEVLEVHV